MLRRAQAELAHSQARESRPALLQEAAKVPASPFSSDPRATAALQSSVEQQLAQQLVLDQGHVRLPPPVTPSRCSALPGSPYRA